MKRSKSESAVIVGGLILTSMILGCGFGAKIPSDFPKLTPCTLTITQDGSPAEGIFVTPVHNGERLEWPIYGVTDANGVAVIKTLDKYSGIPQGEYTLVLTRQETELSEKSLTGCITYTFVESKFTDVTTSPLKLTVGMEPIKQTIDAGKKIRKRVL